MENKEMKCVKGKSCLHCGSKYCRFVDELDQLKVAKEQAEQKLKQIEKLCIKNSTKSSFCNGIENKDMQKLAIRILQINEVK